MGNIYRLEHTNNIMLHGCDKKDTYSMEVYNNVTNMRMPIRNSVQLTDNSQTIALRA